MSSDAPRKPLIQLDPETRAKILQEMGLDENMIPLNASELEREAYLKPMEIIKMEIKPGYKTTEFWIKLLVIGIVLPFIAYISDSGLDNAKFPVWIAATVPALKVLLGLAAAWLAKKYADNRTELKSLEKSQ